MENFLDKLYTDDHFTSGFLDALGEQKRVEYLAEHGIQLTKEDIKRLNELSGPTPDFDIRLAGGVYNIEAGPHNVWDLLVDPVNRNVYGLLPTPAPKPHAM